MLSDKQSFYLNRAISNALLSPGTIKHGCVVVKGGKIVGEGMNTLLPCPYSLNCSRHAEMAALYDYYTHQGKMQCFLPSFFLLFSREEKQKGEKGKERAYSGSGKDSCFFLYRK